MWRSLVALSSGTEVQFVANCRIVAGIKKAPAVAGAF
jgi:hypothetical protein